MAKTKLYNPSTGKTQTFDSEVAKRLLAYQAKVKSKTRFEPVKDKPKEQKTDD